MIPPAAAAPDVVGERCACLKIMKGRLVEAVARPAVGGDEDLAKDAQQEDRLDQDHDGDRARHVRQDDVAERG